MIIDSISRADMYNIINPRFVKAFAYLRTNDLRTFAAGRYQIDGDDIFVTVADCELKHKDDAPLEAHDKYTDIQLVLSGEETFGWRDRNGCQHPDGEFSVEKDIIFFKDRPSTYYTLGEGEFSIFFPGDAHAPMIGKGMVKKCIVKVRSNDL